MKKKKLIGVGLAIIMSLNNLIATYADEYDDFIYWIITQDQWDNDYLEENKEYLTPVITSPSPYDTILSSDGVKIRWKYTGVDKCVVYVQDSAGNVSQLNDEGGNKVTILPNKLAKGASYTITVCAGNKVSEPKIIEVADNKREIVEMVYRTDIERAESRIDRDIVLPEGAFETEENAKKMVKTINVNVWKMNSKGEKYSSTISLVVNGALADTVTKLFKEIYENELKFPIKSASCYYYRTTASGKRLSEHAYGTAIDINPDENYCVYSEDNIVGTCYEPYQNPYSLTPEIINIFRKYNFSWGGSFEDYMHFSYFGT